MSGSGAPVVERLHTPGPWPNWQVLMEGQLWSVFGIRDFELPNHLRCRSAYELPLTVALGGKPERFLLQYGDGALSLRHAAEHDGEGEDPAIALTYDRAVAWLTDPAVM